MQIKLFCKGSLRRNTNLHFTLLITQSLLKNMQVQHIPNSTYNIYNITKPNK